MTAGQVQIVDLVKRFAEVTAVDGINLDVAGGEFFSLSACFLFACFPRHFWKDFSGPVRVYMVDESSTAYRKEPFSGDFPGDFRARSLSRPRAERTRPR